MEKLNACKQNGYDVMIVWQSEYENNKHNIIEKCKEFLSE